jgi:hypothetical protein
MDYFQDSVGGGGRSRLPSVVSHRDSHTYYVPSMVNVPSVLDNSNLCVDC